MKPEIESKMMSEDSLFCGIIAVAVLYARALCTLCAIASHSCTASHTKRLANEIASGAFSA
eukprot:3862841-Amphidinium_carterae.2